jgi:hypothetical protein
LDHGSVDVDVNSARPSSAIDSMTAGSLPDGGIRAGKRRPQEGNVTSIPAEVKPTAVSKGQGLSDGGWSNSWSNRPDLG